VQPELKLSPPECVSKADVRMADARPIIGGHTCSTLGEWQPVPRQKLMRQDPDFFGDTELSLLYIAKKLKEALAVEDVLTKAKLEYLVEPDTYRGGIIFASERIGAFFYVMPESLEQAQEVLTANSYKPYTAK
jgi:hypothetical protein